MVLRAANILIMQSFFFNAQQAQESHLKNYPNQTSGQK